MTAPWVAVTRTMVHLVATQAHIYDGRMERYMQPEGIVGGFPPCGSSGYSTAGYGYGPAYQTFVFRSI
ncbi:hypothetical protein NC652_025147 [Populus alba x Populus x berolinensis]|nr:hypothetical protein NC652_025147 [Populus alba x Populus x berolinensis]